jgi:hypothetical protein
MNSNTNKSILIVNDVQDFNPGGVYCCKNYEPLAKIEELIDFAKENGDYIFVVRYSTPECGPIHPRILRRLAGYADWRMVKKPADFNGAKWIIEMCLEMGISMDRFIMSGFETHSCVQSTTRGLKVRLPNCQIEVIQDACDDQNGNRWRTFPELPGVVLLNTCQTIERKRKKLAKL